MKIQHNASTCASLGMCEATAPDHFELDDDGYLQILQEDVDPSDPAAVAEVEKAVRACPTQSLRLLE